MKNKIDIRFWEYFFKDKKKHAFKAGAFLLMLKTNRKAQQIKDGSYQISYRDMMYYSNLKEVEVKELVKQLESEKLISYDEVKKVVTITTEPNNKDLKLESTQKWLAEMGFVEHGKFEDGKSYTCYIAFDPDIIIYILYERSVLASISGDIKESLYSYYLTDKMIDDICILAPVPAFLKMKDALITLCAEKRIELRKRAILHRN
ncbi:MAG: hypothetical protein M9949_06070 [Candidatus Kapabacteria bacterium]|nr:hypothetical protein [Candidatus Kapabacteria bacterium]